MLNLTFIVVNSFLAGHLAGEKNFNWLFYLNILAVILNLITVGSKIV